MEEIYTGITAFVKVGETIIASISNFNLDKSRDIVEGAYFGKEYKVKKPTIKDWSASADGDVNFKVESGQKLLDEAFEEGTLLTFIFGIQEDLFFEGKGYIESLSITHDAEGKAEISISIAGSDGIELNIPESY